MHSTWSFALILGAFLESTTSIQDARPDDERQILLSIRDAYLTNRNSIERGWGRFELRTGSAKNPRDAIDKKWKPSIKANVYWVFEGRTCRFDIIYDPDDVKRSVPERPKNARGPVPITGMLKSTRAVTDRSKTIIDLFRVNGSHQVEIEHGTAKWESGFAPLGLGLPDNDGSMSLAEDIDRGLSGNEYITRFKGEEQYEDRTVAVVLLERTDGGGSKRYLVDLERGAVPLRATEMKADGSPYLDMFYLDLREYGTDHWLPHRYVNVQLFGRTPAVKEQEATEIHVNEPLPDDALRLRFDDKTWIVDTTRSVRFEVGPKVMIGLDPLPLVPPGANQLVSGTAALPLTPYTPPAKSYSWLVWTVCLSVSVAIGLLLARKVYFAVRDGGRNAR